MTPISFPANLHSCWSAPRWYWHYSSPRAGLCISVCWISWDFSQPILSACPGPSGWQHSPLVNQPLSQHCIAGDGRAKGRIWQMAQSLLPSGFKLKKPSDFVDFISPHITSTQLHSQVTWTFWDDSLRSSACCSVHPWLYLERNILILWHQM